MILSLKSFRKSLGKTSEPCLLIIITIHFACSYVKHQKVSKNYDHDCLQNFCFHFMSLLTAQIIFRLEFTLSLKRFNPNF